jgi:hypothetical protein
MQHVHLDQQAVVTLAQPTWYRNHKLLAAANYTVRGASQFVLDCGVTVDIASATLGTERKVPLGIEVASAANHSSLFDPSSTGDAAGAMVRGVRGSWDDVSSDGANAVPVTKALKASLSELVFEGVPMADQSFLESTLSGSAHNF